MPYFINTQLRNHLVEIDYKGHAIAELAESWESTPDAVTWTFKLRKDVEFHNGKTMDAEDVIYSLNLHRGKDSKSGAATMVKPVKEIKKDGKYSVVFTLKDGNVDFPFILSTTQLSIVPSGTTDFSKGMGTGPYMLVGYEPGVRSLTKRNPNYWKKGRAHFEEVETLGINDTTARTNALISGQIDVMDRIDRKTANLLEKNDRIQIVKINGTWHYTFPMRTDTPPFDNNDVRLGLKHAIDRENLIKNILRGYGTVANDHPISPANPFYARDLPQRQYDPDKARYYLKKAGALDYTFKLHASDAAFSGAVDASILYAEHANQAGIKIEVVREPEDGYWSNVWTKKPWVTAYWYGRVTADWMFSIVYAENAAWNDTYWKNERFNKLLKEARAEFNETKRHEMYAEMQALVSNEGGVVIPCFVTNLFAASSKLKFENISPNFDFDGLLLHERWWFES
jgi:peptide/nickel transport system substrate-binding protein